MQVSVEKKGALGRQMNVVIPAEKVDAAFNSRYEQLAKTMKVDGFRPGQVPLSVIKQRVGEGVAGEVAEQLVRESLAEAFDKEKLQPAAQPHMHNETTPKEGEDFSFHVHFDVMPEVKPTKFEGLKLDKETAEATDAMVEDTLKELSQAVKEFSKKEGAATNGDRMTIDAVGYMDGEDEPFEGGRLADHQIVLGSNMLIPGFEEGLEGLKVGDKKSLKLTFPKDYHAEHMAGAKTRFDVEVKGVEAPAETKMDGEFAKKFGAETMDELKTKIKERLAADLQKASDQRLRRIMFDKIDAANQFEVPPSLVEQEFNAIWQNQMQDLQQRGLPLEALGKNEDDLKAEYRTLAERRVRLGLVLAEIGKTKEVKVEAADIQAEVDKIAESMPEQAEQVHAYYARPEARQPLISSIFEQKVVAWLMENNTITEKTIKPEDLMTELNG